MKKLLLVAITFVFTSQFLQAQTEFGVKAGFFNSERATNILFENDGIGSNGNFNQGIYIGAFAGFKLSERFTLQPEINYAYVKNDFDQLRIPILGSYRIGKKFKVFLGPNVGVLLTNNKNFNKINLGVTAAVSYELVKKLSIELRYNYVFTESLKDDFIGSYDYSTKFNSTQIGLVYRF